MVLPAAIRSTAPIPLSVDPTVTDTEPAEPLAADPDTMVADPDAPAQTRNNDTCKTMMLHSIGHQHTKERNIVRLVLEQVHWAIRPQKHQCRHSPTP